MTEIEIENAAREAATALMATNLSIPAEAWEEVREHIQRAILAERERCARIAEYWTPSPGSIGLRHDGPVTANEACPAIATAIRKAQP